MSSSTMQSGVRNLRRLLAVQERQDDSDDQLLNAFLSSRDDSAFAVLVRRHGPMVLHVCRRVLGNQQDAEDAFQATFLVLARSAASLRNKTALASFLHGTAYRTALKAKRSAARRRKHEEQTPLRSPANPSDELLWREVRTLLDEEIARLPEIYRSVFILCCLESVGREEAARRLGVKEGTVASRVAEARKRLQKRLVRRGVELTAVLGVLALETQPAALSMALVTSTTKAALASLGGQAMAGLVSAPVAELLKSAAAAGMLGKTKMATAILLIVSLLAVATSGSLVGLYGLASEPLAATPAEPPAAKIDDKPKAALPKREAAKSIELQGRVLGPDGQPKAAAKLLLLGEGDKPQQLGVSAADGRFIITVPKVAKGRYLIAQADGTGIDFLELPRGDAKKPIEFRLVKDHVIRGRIVNTEGKPVAGVRVAVDNLGVYPNNSLDSFLAIWKQRQDVMSGLPNGVKHIWQGAASLFAATTNADGRFVLHGTGDERLVSLRLREGGIAEAELWIVNRQGFDPKPYNEAVLLNSLRIRSKLFGNRWRLYGSDLSFVAEAGKTIRGVVKDADTGKGRPGVLVRLTRNGGELVSPIVEARTDAAGRYEMRGARKAKAYMVEVASDSSAGYMACQVRAADTIGYQPIAADIPVKKGVIVTGKMIDQATGKPVSGSAMAAVLINNPFAKNYPEFGSSAWIGMKNTDAEGTFRLVAIPGPVLLMGGPNDSIKYKSQKHDAKYPQYFKKGADGFAVYYGLNGGISPLQGTSCKVLQIKPDAQIVEQDILLERASVLPVHIQDADGKPLAGAWVTGVSPENWHYAISCAEDICSAYQVQPDKPRLMVFYHPARKLTGTLRLKGDEKQPVVVKLGPAGSVKGRLLDADGKPLAGVVVDVNYPVREAEEIHRVISKAKQIVSDANGAFTFDELIPEMKFELSFRRGKRRFERQTKPTAAMVPLKPGERRDVGAIELKLLPEKTEQ